MNNELLPEEQDKENEKFLEVLRNSSRIATSITPGERSQIIERVREQLSYTQADASTRNISFLQSTGAGQFNAQMATRQRRKRARILFNSLVAVIMVGLLVGSWLFVSMRGLQSTSGHASTGSTRQTSSTGPSASYNANGLGALMHVLVGGPYFLSELLPIDITITNHSQQAIKLPKGLGTQGICIPIDLTVQATKGESPSYTFPTLPIPCATTGATINGGPMVILEPGKSITIHQYIPMTKSGSVELVMEEAYAITGLAPLVGHWPTMTLQVESTVPANRMLLLQNQGTSVIVKLPARATPDLLYMQTISCDTQIGSVDDRGEWTSLVTTTLKQPACPHPHLRWQYIVSAPGYPIIARNPSS